MVLVACGPYTPSDSLSYDPLIDLINIINKGRPDVCILVRATRLQLNRSSKNDKNESSFVCIHIQGFGLTWHVLCFISCLTQLGPFVDSKHEQIEVVSFSFYLLCTIFEASQQQTV